jgi:uncharacterized membrane protein YdjX (TVP38/TMEM64 family)
MWLRGQLRRRGLLAITTARLVPVGNFSVMSRVAGALAVPLRPFLLGNALGTLAGALALSLFTNRAVAALRAPDVVNVALLTALVGATAGALWWVGRHLARGAQRPVMVAAEGTPL